MKSKFLSAALLAIIAVLALGIAACTKNVRTSQMLMDDEAKPSAEDKALAKESKPQPFPAEPFPSAKAGEIKSSMTLTDLEEFESKEGLLPIGKEARPVPLPEEPKPSSAIKK